jgi:hypothetical protein
MRDTLLRYPENENKSITLQDTNQGLAMIFYDTKATIGIQEQTGALRKAMERRHGGWRADTLPTAFPFFCIFFRKPLVFLF